jgi:predicted transcriptional regulator
MLVKVLKSIADDESLELFRSIAHKDSDSESLRNRTKMTRKQYYSRMSRLMKAGLIKRKNGRHTLTAFGKVIYDTQITIENAINNYWKLKAIDSLEMSNYLPAQELEKVIDSFIDNQEIKAVLVSDNKFNSQLYAGARQQQRTRQLKPELLVR